MRQKNITEGTDSHKEREKRNALIIANIYANLEALKTKGGYCGSCKTHYKGNYTNHQCTH